MEILSMESPIYNEILARKPRSPKGQSTHESTSHNSAALRSFAHAFARTERRIPVMDQFSTEPFALASFYSSPLIANGTIRTMLVGFAESPPASQTRR